MENSEFDHGISELFCSWLSDDLQKVPRSASNYQAAGSSLGPHKKGHFPWLSPISQDSPKLAGRHKRHVHSTHGSFLGAVFYIVEKTTMTSQMTMKFNGERLNSCIAFFKGRFGNSSLIHWTEAWCHEQGVHSSQCRVARTWVSQVILMVIF